MVLLPITYNKFCCPSLLTKLKISNKISNGVYVKHIMSIKYVYNTVFSQQVR
jgi:hypothetical protein